MAKILAPNKRYTGLSASVLFNNGAGETDKPELIEWFKEHGYTVHEFQETEQNVEEKPNKADEDQEVEKPKRSKVKKEV